MTATERAALVRVYEAVLAAARVSELPPPDLEAVISHYNEANRELAYNPVPPIISTLLVDRRSGNPRLERRPPPTPRS